MNIKLDENMPCTLARILSNLGHQTDTIPEEGLLDVMIRKFGKQRKSRDVF